MVSHRTHRKPAQRGRSWPGRLVVLSAVAGAAAALSPAAPAGARPADPGAGAERSAGARVDRLYAQAEAATEKYNAAAERARELQRQVEYAQENAARKQERVNRLRSALASVAGAQYRSGGIDPSVALMLTEDADGYLDKAATLDRIGSRQEAKLRRLNSAERALRQQRAEADAKLAHLERERAARKHHKKAVLKKLREARAVLRELSPSERAERERASRADGRDAASVPGAGAHASSQRAAAAVAAARSVVGRPYVWGATGPASFDCSGLTQWAYGRAGIAIPRTSQAQRSAGRQVPMSQARPGDLVVYRDDASHVGMYVGGGQVVHAPHPGAAVRYDPVDMMPVTSVTRP
ncbi:cell wall-associated NlpC family hydrolase [Streptomyces sp. Amel2xB2]|uniref:C40 family peptidase n=1 Tax=Streptomyces sp. Amel2xB2 TaxID=1305829 RepID=UPI000DBF6964|nr:C40 family peptidase [Streptomyces sp. Amel2xB2]RAJ65440.1 cell wall-associated NlpC family hydrolase [Streptomyces sp. Amel2xB2]